MGFVLTSLDGLPSVELNSFATDSCIRSEATISKFVLTN